MSALCPLNHAIAAFATANVAIVSNSIKGRTRGAGQGEGRTRQRGKIPLLRGGRGAGQGEGRSETKDGESAQPPPDRANGGKRQAEQGRGRGRWG